VTIVVPARNEGARVGAVLRELAPEWEVLVVDDGSADGTAQAVGEARPGARLIRHPAPRGYGAALKSGILEARRRGAAAAAVLHADGQYSGRDLPRLLGALDSGADLSSGVRRHGRGYPRHRAAGERLLDLALSRAAGRRLRSFSSGLRAYGPRALERIPWGALPDGYEFDAAALLSAARLGLAIAEVPVEHAAGPSGLRPWRYAARALRWAASGRAGSGSP
jgi:glycosyltransferase involved in cell wall biosynthesis